MDTIPYAESSTASVSRKRKSASKRQAQPAKSGNAHRELSQSSLISELNSHTSIATFTALTENSSHPKGPLIENRAAFFNLAYYLQVPILTSQGNLNPHNHGVGGGASYIVQRNLHISNLWRREDDDLYSQPLKHNEKKANNVMEYRIQAGNQYMSYEGFLGHAYVTKRISASDPAITREVDQLAVISKEVRILSEIRKFETSEYFVKILGITWDHEPDIWGQYWPRIILDAATCGSLEEFFGFEDAERWDVKCKLILDVVIAVATLHASHIVHLDLKPENILIFKRKSKPSEASNDLSLKYQAKITDFGSSIILSDFDLDQDEFPNDLLIGTPPWCPPELSGLGIEAHYQWLPRADTYCLGMLMARVFMNGKKPFQGYSPEEISRLKRMGKLDTQADPKGKRQKKKEISDIVFESVVKAVTTYSPDQQVQIQHLLCSVLNHDPVLRPSVIEVGEMLLDLVQTRTTTQYRASSENMIDGSGCPRGGCVTEDSKASMCRVWPREGDVGGLPDIYSAATNANNITRTAENRDFEDVIMLSTQATSMIRQRLLNIHRQECQMQKTHLRIRTFEEIVPNFALKGITDLEDLHMNLDFNEIFLPILQCLTEEISRYSNGDGSDPMTQEATYQMAYAHLSGIGVPMMIKDYSGLEKAALMGSEKALKTIWGIYDSRGKSMHPKLAGSEAEILSSIARNEIGSLYIELVGDWLPRRDNLNMAAVSRWSQRFPEDYKNYLRSDDLAEVRYEALAMACRKLIQQDIEIVSHKACKDDLFQSNVTPCSGGNCAFELVVSRTCYESPALLNSSDQISTLIRTLDHEHDWEQPIANHGLTLLQVAAARGDQELVRVLVDEFGAKVDGKGWFRFHGLTPFLLSCMFGHYEVAIFLHDKGADVDLREPFHHRSILHFLHQFKTEKEVLGIWKICLESGIDINEEDSLGRNPVASKFVGWDFSQGTATRILLDRGVEQISWKDLLWKDEQPTLFLHRLIGDLSVELIEKVLLCIELSTDGPNLDFGPQRSDQETIMSTGCIVDAIVSIQVRYFFWAKTSEIVQLCSKFNGRNPGEFEPTRRVLSLSDGEPELIGIDPMQGVKDIFSKIYEQGGVDKKGNTMLHHIVERMVEGMVVGMSGFRIPGFPPRMIHLFLTTVLSDSQADPLTKNSEGSTFFHYCARFSAEVLLLLISDILDGTASRSWPNWDHTIGAETILNLADDEGLTVWMLLVLYNHLTVAEDLFKSFQIKYDDYSIPEILSADVRVAKTTFMAYLYNEEGSACP